MNKLSADTVASLFSLLSYLNDDPELAGEQFLQLRRKLEFFFESWGARAPAEHTDETLDRVSRKIADGVAIRDLDSYCLGVARYVWMEASKALTKDEPSLDDDFWIDPRIKEKDEEAQLIRERILECQKECLQELPPETAWLLREYCDATKKKGAKIVHRKSLAKQLRISRERLRSRICTIRDGLRASVNARLEEKKKPRK